jgi:hypothetical protein
MKIPPIFVLIIFFDDILIFYCVTEMKKKNPGQFGNPMKIL